MKGVAASLAAGVDRILEMILVHLLDHLLDLDHYLNFEMVLDLDLVDQSRSVEEG